MREKSKSILIGLGSVASILFLYIIYRYLNLGDGESAMEGIVGIVAIISGMGSLLVGVSSIFTTSLDNVREYFATGEDCATKTNGIFVAGDCRTKAVRQVSTATADGAVAALAACRYIDSL